MKFFAGLIIFTIGLLFLGINLGWWTNDIWINFFSLWPLILIAFGLRLLIRNDSFFLLSLVSLLLALTFLFAFLGSSSYVGSPDWLQNRNNNERETLTQLSEGCDGDEIKKFELDLSLGAAKIFVGALPGQESNLLFTSRAVNIKELVKTKKIDGDTARVKISQRENGLFFLSPSDMDKREFTIDLNKRLPLYLKLDSGASRANLDFANLNLVQLELKTGASTSEIKFGLPEKTTKANIEMGASSLKILIPEGAGFVLKANSGLTKIEFVGGVEVEKNEDTYTSTNYDAAGKTIEIEISSGVSNIELSRY